MDSVSTATSHSVCNGEEMPLPGNEKQEDSTNSHGPGDSPNPQPFESGEDTVLPHFLPLRDVEAPAFPGAALFQTLEGMEAPAPAVAPMAEQRQILENVIREAFSGRAEGTDDADGVSWENVRTRLESMTLREARRIWQIIGNEVAVDCFDATGNVDVERLRTWMEVFGNAETFREEPFCFIPHVELMRSQICGVCEHLLEDRNPARTLLNCNANDIIVSSCGQSILGTMSNGREPLLRPAEAALASLFTPHR
ncbi:MAG: hypothetical protein LBC11_01950 [Puniceicoccales bacterium]|jgi:hypothetical protein|nr:hypothetical protein [Puniceicoccales bacterium]